MTLETVEEALREVALPTPPADLKRRTREAVAARIAAIRGSSLQGDSPKPSPRARRMAMAVAVILFAIVMVVVVLRESSPPSTPADLQESSPRWGHFGGEEILWVYRDGIADVLKHPDPPAYVERFLATPVKLDLVEVTLAKGEPIRTTITSVYQLTAEGREPETIILKGVTFPPGNAKREYSSESALSYEGLTLIRKDGARGLLLFYPDSRKASLLLVASSMEGEKPAPGKALYRGLLRAASHPRKDLRAAAAHALRFFGKRNSSVTTTIRLLGDPEETVTRAARDTLKALTGINGGTPEKLREWWQNLDSDARARLLEVQDLDGTFEEVPLELRQRIQDK